MRAVARIGLLAPALGTLLGLLVIPMLLVGKESFRLFIPGHVGAATGAPLTLQNYWDFATPTYLGYFADTFVISSIASIAGVAVGFPIAYRVTHENRPVQRRLWIGFLVGMLFLSILVRVYAAALAFGPAGLGRSLSSLFGGLNSRAYAEATIVLGLVHCLIPMAAIALIGPLNNINPRLAEAAQALGAPGWKAHATITIPLAARGTLGAFMICFTFSISAFVIPMVLGKGRILFISNLIYNRFGDVGNFPAGSALAVILLLLSLAFVYTITFATGRRWDR